MSDAQRMAWLRTNPVVTIRSQSGSWVIYGVGCYGTGATFEEALDETIRQSSSWALARALTPEMVSP